jgi:hypothetical protein
LPSRTPPGARLTIDLAHLSETEVQAVDLNPSNRLCYVCHKSKTDLNGEVIGHTIVGGSSSGNLPTSPSGQPLPPSIGRGTIGSIIVRVNSKGPKGVDCLGCHDVHNLKTQHMLRDDYGQTQDP